VLEFVYIYAFLKTDCFKLDLVLLQMFCGLTEVMQGALVGSLNFVLADDVFPHFLSVTW